MFQLRCAELGLHDTDLATMSVGMVYDMLIERNNDNATYEYVGTQEDIQRIFG